MAELLRSGAVFIHVPKCGGNWVREALRELGLWRCRIGYKHSTPERINDVWRHHRMQFLRHLPTRPDVTPGKLRRAFKFCFVRNPLTWYESWWKFMAGSWHPWEVGRWHPQRPIDDCGDDDFNVFLENVLRVRPGYVSEMYGWYVEGCHFVGRCESLASDLVRALEASGTRVAPGRLDRIPPSNVSESRLGAPAWNSELLRRIVASEEQAIERFGYWPEVERFCGERKVALGS
jgi:hypothetical protein